LSVTTQPDDDIHESILDDNERKERRYSSVACRNRAYWCISALSRSWLAHRHPDEFFRRGHASMFAINLKPEFIFYPPIVTFFVDLMHLFATSLER